MKVHFIAIGGSAMHNLAIALHEKGYKVTGSDDEIFEPSRTRLQKRGLLPEEEGWYSGKVNKDLDAVILGMHAKGDNPELKKANDLGLPVYSYPEYLYEQSKDKKRVVIGGSHGKTTITAMILHVLHYYDVNVDYMVGAQLEGFEVMVRLSDDAEVMVLEGDEYLSSALDPRPKFHLYRPDVALLSGIAWDHINVFPTYENYVNQFRKWLDLITQGGKLIYCEDDHEVVRIVREKERQITELPYTVPEYSVMKDSSIVYFNGMEYQMKIFGRHNMLNLNGARYVCNDLGIGDDYFFKAMQEFKGASKRLQKIGEGKNTVVFKDFAHSPSKLKATVDAVKERFPDRKLVACMELHTYSSLSGHFLKEYKGSMNNADLPVVYYDEHALKLKRLPDLKLDEVVASFKNPDIKVFNNPGLLKSYLLDIDWEDSILLLMSSGNFGGIDLDDLASRIV